MKDGEIRQQYGNNRSTFLSACKNLHSIIEKEWENTPPDIDYIAALGALGLAFSHMAELVKGHIAISIAMTVANKGEGNNCVFFAGDRELIEKNNDFLLEAIQKEILKDYNVEG